MSRIAYRDGYKYQLHEAYTVQTAIRPIHDITTPFITLAADGALTVMAGYAWDGGSGPAIDTKDFMRPSLVHDALYQLMRARLLDVGWREAADAELKRIYLEDAKAVKRPWGLGWLKHLAPARAWWIFRGVRLGGEGAAEWQEDEVCYAP